MILIALLLFYSSIALGMERSLEDVSLSLMTLPDQQLHLELKGLNIPELETLQAIYRDLASTSFAQYCAATGHKQHKTIDFLYNKPDITPQGLNFQRVQGVLSEILFVIRLKKQERPIKPTLDEL